MKPKRTHVVIPEEIINEIDLLVGKRRRSQFISEAVRERLKRLKLDRAIDRAAGSWKDADHPDMAGGEGTNQWVHAIRMENEERFRHLIHD